MKSPAAFVLAISALASAQVIYNATTNEYICSRPNAQWCAGDSFDTDIIIRCDAQGRGQPGRCTNNLAGYFPLGVNPSLCWQSTLEAGDAACEKNCIVYTNPPFLLPPNICTPYATPTGSQTIGTARPPPSGTGVGVATGASFFTGGGVLTVGGVVASSGSTNTTTTATGSSTSVYTTYRPIGTGTGGIVAGAPLNGTIAITRVSGTGAISGGTLVNGTVVLLPTRTRVVSAGNPSSSAGNPSNNNPGQGDDDATPGQPNQPAQSGDSAGNRTPIPPSSTPTGPSILPTAGASRIMVSYIAVIGILAVYFL
ncbi:uncharacterized protein CTRU02_200348 [Colletotrichum truncatum]|uniref:Uncharacterized protein n=1 Tax=Colletotrichum truncatum TaxID=5467 RepID=A0ACC3ZEA6_COLTU|nr:uncharacterized protein CTRU02_00105 [Colletotrichum truncatum]KAF6801356.1 hypothetical protein CTRU02_00105 [Colletotrichum truncatum]